MASVQVLPSSVASAKKKEHLQAGKRRLEEFRKKKAAKKALSNNASEVNSNENQPLENDHATATDTAVAGSSEPSSVSMNNGNIYINDYSSISYDQQHSSSNDQELKSFGASNSDTPLDNTQAHVGIGNDLPNYGGGSTRFLYGTMPDKSNTLDSQGSQDFGSMITPGIVETRLKEENAMSKDYTSLNTGSSHVSVSRISPQNSIGSLLSELSSADRPKPASQYEDLIRPSSGKKGFSDGASKVNSSMTFSEIISSKSGKENISNSVSTLYGMENGDVHKFGSGSFQSNYRIPRNPIPLYPVTNETNAQRSRPSFLDNLNISRVSVETQMTKDLPEKDLFKSNSLLTNGMEFPGSSPFYEPPLSAGSFSPPTKLDTISSPQASEFRMSPGSGGISSNQPNLPVYENGMDMKHEFYLPPKQTEDFSTLEQHIEDLTQEKFSLQRALETSSFLAESLAAENSSLTESYNQQRGVVDQLKSDMENLKDEIKARLAELEALRNEYANAHLECSAADERAKLLASEVIALEEKALRLRSNELKLERQLENSQAEISAYKKRMSSIEKDRMDLQSTIDALQEEKKLLLSKLRKASANGKPVADAPNPTTNRKDVSTSTEDLANEDARTDISSHELREAFLVGTEAFSSTALPVDGFSISEDSFANIPPHQLRMIQNINTLISELALEKQELVQALTSESSLSSKLKELNNELSRKLEAQTQRLELLTAQSMAIDHIPVRQPDPRDTPENIQYADEGDEVVERVLGWIMKLFPGGPSKRRTSKRL